jgi:hypothetical protein
MPANRGVALALALFGAVYLAPGLPRWATVEAASQVPGAAGDVGSPGPSAVGVSVNPHQLPTPASAGTPAADSEVPRRFPVDQETFERMKEQANAEAAATATAEEEAP